MPNIVKSYIRDNRKRGTVADFLKNNISPDAEMSVVSAYFTIYAYKKLQEQLDGIKHLKFLFGEPNFIKIDPSKSATKEFNITNDRLSMANTLEQGSVARECAAWIEAKVSIKSMVKPNFLHGKLYHIKKANGVTEAIVGSSNFTVNGLGLGKKPNIELNLILQTKSDVEDIENWFEEAWNESPELVEDVKEQVLKYLSQLYTERSPEFIYYKTLFHLFEEYLNNERKGNLITQKTGFFETEIYNLLYSFQQDGVKAAINKIEKHGGCIIADSVGLGKTFEALAVIKYFELRNDKVLVICPKKLSENWTVYQSHKNNAQSPFTKDRFSYSVIYHTDLNRKSGNSLADGLDLSNFNWGAFDLVVIDESHNFRNNGKGKTDALGEKTPSRYERLMEDIIQKGLKTKVLLLSATPVNNNLKDLRNQLFFLTEGKDDALLDDGVKSIANTLRVAQTQFSAWADPKKNPHRNAKDLFERLDTGFFKLLDELTIARSRKQIKRNYDLTDIGEFPHRNKPISVYPALDIADEFPSYDNVNKYIVGFTLALYKPTTYVQEAWKTHYENQAGTQVRAFKQADRENFLIGMMKVGLLKRLESSVESFEISMTRTIEKVKTLMKKIEDFQLKKTTETELDIEAYLPEPDDDDDQQTQELYESLMVGKKFKLSLAHLDLDRWLKDLKDDKDKFINLKNNAHAVTPERDAKLLELKKLITQKIHKPLNHPDIAKEGVKKVIVFTAFADTAKYLYDNLHPWFKQEFKLESALVCGGVDANKTTFMTKGFANQSDFNAILTNFSPYSKKRNKLKNMPQKGEIDLLVATDCISEGQNLQDCDFLVNYDIHWNPVRIIQRFGRIDRLGSQNKKIQLVNFWPTKDLDNYINLKERVEARMALVDITATGDDNLLNNKEIEDIVDDQDLKFRQKQLLKFKDEILDLEDLGESVSLSDFTLDDFRTDLLAYLNQHRELLGNAPEGLYAVVPSPCGAYQDLGEFDKLSKTDREIIRPGIIFCLRQKNNSQELENVNPLNPYFLVYIRDDGTVRFNYMNAKQTLEMFRILCMGNAQPYEQLCDIFRHETQEGKNMEKQNDLLKKALHAIATMFKKKAAQQLLSGRGGMLIDPEKQVSDDSHFDLLTWLVIK